MRGVGDILVIVVALCCWVPGRGMPPVSIIMELPHCCMGDSPHGEFVISSDWVYRTAGGH